MPVCANTKIVKVVHLEPDLLLIACGARCFMQYFLVVPQQPSRHKHVAYAQKIPVEWRYVHLLDVKLFQLVCHCLGLCDKH